MAVNTLVIIALLAVIVFAVFQNTETKQKQPEKPSDPENRPKRKISSVSSKNELNPDLAAILDTDTYNDLKDTFSKIEETTKTRLENEGKRIKLEKHLLQTMLNDLKNLQIVAGKDPIICTLKDRGNMKLTYNNDELTLNVHNGGDIETYVYTEEQTLIYCSYMSPKIDSIYKNNREFREHALPYLLPWETTLCGIVAALQGSIRKYQDSRLSEAVKQESQEKEKMRELLTALGFDPDDPESYNAAFEKYDVVGQKTKRLTENDDTGTGET